MANTTIADFCDNVCAMLGSVIDSDEPLSISTENTKCFLAFRKLLQKPA